MSVASNVKGFDAGSDEEQSDEEKHSNDDHVLRTQEEEVFPKASKRMVCVKTVCQFSSKHLFRGTCDSSFETLLWSTSMKPKSRTCGGHTEC